MDELEQPIDPIDPNPFAPLSALCAMPPLTAMEAVSGYVTVLEAPETDAARLLTALDAVCKNINGNTAFRLGVFSALVSLVPNVLQYAAKMVTNEDWLVIRDEPALRVHVDVTPRGLLALLLSDAYNVHHVNIGSDTRAETHQNG